MSLVREYTQRVMDYIDAMLKRPWPLVLGGIAGPGGGSGSPPGGVIGKLAQTRICYDTTEAATAGSTPAPSLVHNLNRIRHGIAMGDDSTWEQHILWSTGCLIGTSGCIDARHMPFYNVASDIVSETVRDAIEEVAEGLVTTQGIVRYYCWAIDGDLSLDTGGLRLYTSGSVEVEMRLARASVGTAPTGANVIVDINKNGTTIFTDQGNRPEITAGTNMATGVPDVDTLVDGDYMTMDVDQVGTTSPGADLVVQVECVEVRVL
jgi:hypothetical protein